MPARHNFSANQIRERIVAALNLATLEVMVQTQTELQKMVSKPGKGRLYAKSARGVRNLARYFDETAGLSRKYASRIETARFLRQSQGLKEQGMRSVIGADATRRYQSTQRFLARRVGVQLGERQIRSLMSRANVTRLGDMGIHRASAPGDPPTVRTGTLRRSIQMARPTPSRASTRVGWRIGIKVKYAPYLEFGTRRMRPRPYVKPVIQKMRSIAVTMITNRLRLSGLYGTRLY